MRLLNFDASIEPNEFELYISYIRPVAYVPNMPMRLYAKKKHFSFKFIAEFCRTAISEHLQKP